MENKSHPAIRVLRIGGILILAVILIVLGFFGLLTAIEYRPADIENMEIAGSSERSIEPGSEVKVLSWNIGYLGLGESADFFMDGGKGVRSQTKEQVEGNLTAISDEITASGADFVLLQEVDRNSTRSYHINEADALASLGSASVFAPNFEVLWIPYPLPPIGKVDGGILTVTSRQITEALRYQLPCPFKWPVRIGNLKRCVLMTRTPVSDSDKELVVVNLHLEAYDDGEGKAAQTQLLAKILSDEAEKGNYVIAGGDFNQVFSNSDQDAFPAHDGYWAPGEVDVSAFPGFTALQDSSVPSCRSLDRPLDTTDENFQYYLIDGFIVSDNLQINSIRTEDLGFKNSDHNPVTLTVTIP